MPDYMFLLESRLMPEQRATMMRVQELSAALGLIHGGRQSHKNRA